MKTHWKKQFNYDYLGSYSLPDGNDLILTIAKTGKEMITGQNGQKEECFVVHFKEDAKPMIMNRTNAKTIEKIYTPYIEDWIGKSIQVYTEKVKAFGDVMDALRIRPKQPNLAKPELTPEHEKWGDAVNHLKSGKPIEAITKHFELSEANQNKLMEESL